MDAQLKAKWVEALRSKKYRQADGTLREEQSARRYGYCCLGVLCHAMGSKWIDGTPVLDGVVMEDEDESYLSRVALEMTGLDEQTQKTLANMNDNGSRFPEIADYIEANL